MELKQWLYRNGDQCVWNTGGWVKGIVNSSTTPKKAQYGNTSTPSVSASVSFNSTNISYVCNGTARRATGYGGDSDGRYYYWSVGGYSLNVNFCTQNPLKIDISKYTKTVLTSGNVSSTFRTGSANSANTSVDTATVLNKGVANRAINIGNARPYFVVGQSYSYGGQNSVQGRQNDGEVVNSVNYNCTITEIYLV